MLQKRCMVSVYSRNPTSSATDFVCDLLRSEILSFRLLPKEPLVEEELAVRFGVSRTPVREALRSLEKECLVSRIPSRGCFVSDVEFKTVFEAYYIRECLESAAARIATPTITTSAIDEMRQLCRRIRSTPRDNDDLLWNEEMDQQVHRIVLDTARNALLKDTVDQTRRLTQRVMFMVPSDRYEGAIHEHLRIADALEARNADAAADAMREHLQNAARRLLPYLSWSPGVGAPIVQERRDAGKSDVAVRSSGAG